MTLKGVAPLHLKRGMQVAEINESNIWVLWENPTGKDGTGRFALR